MIRFITFTEFLNSYLVYVAAILGVVFLYEYTLKLIKKIVATGVRVTYEEGTDSFGNIQPARKYITVNDKVHYFNDDEVKGLKFKYLLVDGERVNIQL